MMNYIFSSKVNKAKPNAVTCAAMHEARSGKKLEKTSLKKLKKDWYAHSSR